MVFYRVADGVYLHVRNRQEIGKHAGAAAADSDDAETYGISGLKFHADHGLVRCSGTRGRLESERGGSPSGESRADQADAGLEELPSRNLPLFVLLFIRCH